MFKRKIQIVCQCRFLVIACCLVVVGAVPIWVAAQNSQPNGQLSFVAISHMHRTLDDPPSDVFDRAVEKINGLEPDFVMFLGDYIRGYDNFIADWGRFNKVADKIKSEKFMIAGNHDITDKPADKLVSDLTKLEYYQKNFGDLYYSFNKADNLFIALNGVNSFDGVIKNDIDPEQLNFLGEELERSAEYKNVFIFISQCSWLEPNSNWRSEVAPIINGRVDYVMCGDTNTPYYTKIDNVTYVMGGMGTESQVENKNFFIQVTIADTGQVEMFPVLIDDGNFLDLPDFLLNDYIDYNSSIYNYSQLWGWAKDHAKMVAISVSTVAFLLGLFIGRKIKRIKRN